MEALNLIKKYKYHLFIAFNLLWIWALLSPNIYYFDDGYRAAGGFYNWGGDFRPLADWLYYILGMGSRFTDLTPLPQILALFFIYTVYFFYIKNFSNGEINFLNLFVYIPIVWSPFLLANLYFRYDSIFMSLAILLSVFAIFDIDHKRYMRATFFLFVALGFYQPSIIAYVCTALFSIYKIEQDSKKIIFKLWVKNSIVYFFFFLIALLLYYFIIMKFTTNYNNYSSTHSQIAIKNIIPNVFQAIEKVCVIFQGDTGKIFLVFFFYLILMNFIFLIKKTSYFGLFIFFITNIIFIVSVAGVNLLLDVPRFEYRTFIFFGFYIVYLLLSASKIITKDKYKKYMYIILFFINFYFYSIALNVSNIQKIQSSFEEMLVFDIANTISVLDIDKSKTFIFVGSSYPSNVDVLSDKYPLIKTMTINPVHFSFKIKKYYPTEFKTFTFNNLKKEKIFIKKMNNLHLIQRKMFFNIYEVIDENLIVIYLKKPGGLYE